MSSYNVTSHTPKCTTTAQDDFGFGGAAAKFSGKRGAMFIQQPAAMQSTDLNGNFWKTTTGLELGQPTFVNMGDEAGFEQVLVGWWLKDRILFP